MAGTRARGRGQGVLRVDPAPALAASPNAAIAFFARRDLLGAKAGHVSDLWELPEPRSIVYKQNPDGSWRYPGANPAVRSQQNYDQLETFRQIGMLVEKFGFTREHPSVERAAGFLFSFQSGEGDFRGIYGEQYATTYVGGIAELLIKAGYAGDPRIDRVLRWLMSARQQDGGWAIPARTAGLSWPGFVDPQRYPAPVAADPSKPSSHLVTGMALRAFAAHPGWRAAPEVQRAAELLVTRLYKRDFYPDRGARSYWERVSFPFWFTDIVSALDTLSRLGLSQQAEPIDAALRRLCELQCDDGTFALKLLRNKDPDLRWWVCLAICRTLRRWQRQRGRADSLV